MDDGSAAPRSACPINFALEIFGDRWSLLILRDILLKNKRHYRELLALEEGIATNVLADRLKRLESRGIVTRTRDADDRRQIVYRATEPGIALIPVLMEISAWAARHDPHSGAPADFPARYAADRAGMIARITQAARADRGDV